MTADDGADGLSEGDIAVLLRAALVEALGALNLTLKLITAASQLQALLLSGIGLHLSLLFLGHATVLLGQLALSLLVAALNLVQARLSLIVFFTSHLLIYIKFLTY